MLKNRRNNSRIENKIIKQIIAQYLERTEKAKLPDIIELIRPLCSFSETELLEKALSTKVRYIMSTFRDSQKIRKYFLNSKGVYINVDETADLRELDRVDVQLGLKYRGLASAIGKVRNKIDSVILKYRRNKFTED